MWPRLAAIAGVVLAVFAAGWFSNGWRIHSQQQAQQIAQDAANRQALAARDAEIKTVLEDYREKIAALGARRPLPRVRCTSPDSVPVAAGGAPGEGAPELDRRDDGPLLRACTARLLQLNALIDWYDATRSPP